VASCATLSTFQWNVWQSNFSPLFGDVEQPVFTCTGPSLALCDEEHGKGFTAASQKALRQRLSLENMDVVQ
jgi:hypothetical protein